MRVIYCVQGSDDWWQAKRGVPSTSNFDRIITSKGKLSKGADPYIAELIADLKCQTPNYFSSRGISRPMQNGHDTEPEARRYYAMLRSVDVQQVGVCFSDDGRFCCSPDGLIGERQEYVGGLELKCPELKTQVAYHIKGGLPREYKQQVHGALAVTGLPYWDFLSYAPDVAPLLIRVEPDDYTLALKSALEDFWARYQELKARLIQREPGCEA